MGLLEGDTDGLSNFNCVCGIVGMHSTSGPWKSRGLYIHVFHRAMVTDYAVSKDSSPIHDGLSCGTRL